MVFADRMDRKVHDGDRRPELSVAVGRLHGHVRVQVLELLDGSEHNFTAASSQEVPVHTIYAVHGV